MVASVNSKEFSIDSIDSMHFITVDNHVGNLFYVQGRFLFKKATIYGKLSIEENITSFLTHCNNMPYFSKSKPKGYP